MRQQVNLFSPLFRRQEKKFSARAMLQASGAVVIGIALLYGLLWWSVLAQRAHARTLATEQAEAVRRLADVSQRIPIPRSDPRLEREVRDLEHRLQAIERLRAVGTRDLFQGVSGYSDYFIAFARQSVSGLWLTGITVAGAGEELVLEGRAYDPALVPRYLDRLSGERALQGSEFEVFQLVRPEVDEGKGEKRAQPRLASHVEFVIKTVDKKPAGGKP